MDAFYWMKIGGRLWGEQSSGAEEDDDFVERVHRDRRVDHWQRDLCLPKWCPEGEMEMVEIVVKVTSMSSSRTLGAWTWLSWCGRAPASSPWSEPTALPSLAVWSRSQVITSNFLQLGMFHRGGLCLHHGRSWQVSSFHQVPEISRSHFRYSLWQDVGGVHHHHAGHHRHRRPHLLPLRPQAILPWVLSSGRGGQDAHIKILEIIISQYLNPESQGC